MTSPSSHSACLVSAILFDFGGVVAEEGFALGLAAIARAHGKDEAAFLARASDIAFESGYVDGRSSEEFFWHLLRDEQQLVPDEDALRQELLTRFRVRPWMLELADALAAKGLTVGLLSDQTNWLDELDAEQDVYRHFGPRFVSWTLGMNKRGTAIFPEVSARLGLAPGQVLFIDDNAGNVQRAALSGMKTIHYRNSYEFRAEMAFFCPGLAEVLNALIPENWPSNWPT